MRNFLIISLLLFCSAASAATYEYFEFAPGYDGVHYQTKEAACSAGYSASSADWSFDYARPDGRCIARIVGGNGDGSHFFWIPRRVDCLDTHEYDYDSKECKPSEPEPEPDKCAEKAGQSTPVKRTGTRGDGYYQTVTINGKSEGVTPDDGCRGGCQVTVQQKCIFTLSSDSYSCIGKGYYTGAACEAAPATQLEESPNTDQREPEVSDTKEPCVYVQDAEGRSHCVSKEVVEKEGQNCGTYQGVSLCVPKTATKDETKVETEVKEETNPDGTKQIVKKDVATETKCEGDKTKCTTKTTTTTTTTNKDGSGTTTKTETVCTGAKCGSTGGGGGGGGSGSGSGEGEEEGEGGELPGNEDAPGFGESVQSFSARVSGSPLMSAVSGISMPTGGSCSMPSASVPMIGSISFNWVCTNSNLLDPLYYVMLAVWALGAVRIFMEA